MNVTGAYARICKEAVSACLKVVPQHLPGETEKKYENPHSEKSVTRPIFGTSTESLSLQEAVR